MANPSDRVYSETHEWHKLDGGVVTLGITAFAVNQLTDLTYVQMKPAGTAFKAGDAVGEVESVKTTSDIYAGAAGEIVEVNDALNDNPGLVNEDPFGTGWLVKFKLAPGASLEGLMNADAYNAKYGD
jgi:glycine cleavage system H protein